MMKILITGGAGFIGSQIANLALAEGHQVTALDSLIHGRTDLLSPTIPLHVVDIRDPNLADLIGRIRPEVVIHHAAQISVSASIKDPAHDLSVNVSGSLNLLNACVRHGIRKIIYPSTAAVFSQASDLPIKEDHPLAFASPYGVSKQAVEHYLQVYRHLYGLSYTILRYANVYGPGQDPRGEGGVAAIFMDALRRGKSPVIFGDGLATRDFVFSGDCARINLLALEALDGEILHVGTGRETTVLDLFKEIARLTGYTQAPRFEPERPGDIRRSCLSPDKLQRLTGADLTSLTEGLQQTLAWYRHRLE